MKRVFRKLMAMGLATAMMASVIGCGASSDDTTMSTTPVVDTAPGTETAEQVQAEASNGPAAFDWLSDGQPAGWTEAKATETLNFHTSSAAYMLDGYAAASGDAGYVMTQLIWDTLIMRDSTSGEYRPWLAESYELSEDGSTMSFTLRQDAYFTNGTQVTADDAVFSFNRLLNDVEHVPDANGKAVRNYVSSIDKTGDFSFTIHFKLPNPEFTYFLISFPILCESAYEEMGYEAYFAKPIGSGPYVVENFDSANAKGIFTIRTDENGWWGYDYANSYSNVKTINVTYAPEATTRLSSLRAGEADLVSDVPTTDADALTAEGYMVDILPATTYIFLQFASDEDSIFNNRDLREAMSLCIDREAIVAALLNGYGYPATTNALPSDLGYRDDIAYEHNIEKAKELLANAGYNGEPIRFIYTTSTVSIANELAQAIQSMAGEVGFNLEVTPLEVAIYDEARNARDFDMCIASIMKSGNMWYKTASEVIGNDRFNTGFTNTELKELGAEAGQTMDQAKLSEILGEMAEIELTEFEPNVYLYFPTLLYARSSSLKDICWHSEHRADLKFTKIN